MRAVSRATAFNGHAAHALIQASGGLMARREFEKQED
jgi:hypothetical protein